MKSIRIVGVLALVGAGFTGLMLSAPSAVASGGQGACIAHRPAYIEDVFEVHYTAGCSGHDEPELVPLSDLPGSARNATWTFELPANGASYDVDAVGPTFWFGGPLNDPNSFLGQAYEELQFYPNAVVRNCNPNGGSEAEHVEGVYTVCSPVWSITTTGNKPNYHEPAAFNGMLSEPGSDEPLVMHEGDTITVHFFVTKAKDGWHINVTDQTSGESGTIVLNSKTDGPLMPSYSVQKLGNSLKWGIVHDAPVSFVWEIGHTSEFSSPASAFCAPGNPECLSYDAGAWRSQSPPIHIDSVTFKGGVASDGWAVVSDYGGKEQVTDPSLVGSTCDGYGGPFCIYPWYTRNADDSISYGVDYPTTVEDYGRANQFAKTTECGGPFGPNSTYCATVIE